MMILGRPGAGKTSFLNVVSGKASAYGTVGGQLLINGNVEPHGISQYKRSVGFVPQEDTMLREMTPKEILTVSKNDGFCIKNEGLCIKNEELRIKNDGFCIKNEGLCIKNDGFCSSPQRCGCHRSARASRFEEWSTRPWTS